MPAIKIKIMTHKGHYGEYSGNAKHSRKTNSWEEQDVKRGRREEREGHTGHAEALFDDAHGSYNYDGSNSTGAEHGTSRRSSSPLNDKAARLRKRAQRISSRVEGQGGYDYENPKVNELLRRARAEDERSGGGKGMKMMMTRHIKPLPKKKT